MSGEREVFIDALQELGFKALNPHAYDLNILSYDDFYRDFAPSDSTDRFRYKSTVKVDFYRTYVCVVWDYAVYPDDEYGVAIHSFMFPSEWDQALAHIRHVIDLAEHKARTGETKPIVRETGPGRGPHRSRRQ